MNREQKAVNCRSSTFLGVEGTASAARFFEPKFSIRLFKEHDDFLLIDLTKAFWEVIHENIMWMLLNGVFENLQIPCSFLPQ